MIQVFVLLDFQHSSKGITEEKAHNSKFHGWNKAQEIALPVNGIRVCICKTTNNIFSSASLPKHCCHWHSHLFPRGGGRAGADGAQAQLSFSPWCQKSSLHPEGRQPCPGASQGSKQSSAGPSLRLCPSHHKPAHG